MRGPFELQPRLIGELLELRPLKEEDFDALFAAASDSLIWEQHPESTRWQKEVFQRYFGGAMTSGGAFVVLDGETGEVIGSSRYCRYLEEESEIEIGYTFLVRSRWGGAYNGEMKQLMLDHAFRFVDRVVFRIGADNWRSRKAVEKIGGVYECVVTDPRGGPGVQYVITRPVNPP